MRRRVRWAVVASLAVLLTAGLVVTLAYPSVASTTCPRCFGLVRLEDGLYAERGLSDRQRADLTAVYADARRRVEAFYGARQSDPVVLACVSTDCYDRIGGGGERGLAVLDRAVLLSPRGLTVVIAAHELSHVEFHDRLGGARDDVPQWFDEGLAVLVADDSRYLSPAGGADRCRVAPAGPLPASHRQWLDAASRDEQVYAQAACRVSRWVNAHGGREAVPDLVGRLHRGEPFATIVGD